MILLAKHILFIGLTAVVMLVGFASSAQAYVGPGLGLGTIAVVLGVIGSVFLALFAVLWYPIKRLMKKRKSAPEAENQQPLDPQ